MSSNNLCDEPSPTQEHRTPADILNAAADLLEKPGAWTQGAASRDAFGNGEEDEALLPDAVCWCMVPVSAELSRLILEHLRDEAVDALAEADTDHAEQAAEHRWEMASGR